MSFLRLLGLLAMAACGAKDFEVIVDSGPDDTPDPASLDEDDDGYTVQQGDCDDTDPRVNPSASEVCDGVDNDCDGLSDGDDDSVDPASMDIWYTDADRDGFGGGEGSLLCEPPPDHSERGGDCNDEDASVYPNAEEVCDGLDQNCDAQIDEGFEDGDSSGLPDCREVFLVVGQGFQSMSSWASCEDLSAAEREATAIAEALAPMGLGLRVVPEGGELSTKEMMRYGAVVYHNGGWGDPMLTPTTEGFQELHNGGQGLLFLGDDLGYLVEITRDLTGSDWLGALVGVEAYEANITYDNELVITDTGHDFVDGPSGTVSSFEYQADLDALVLVERSDLSVALEGAQQGSPAAWSISGTAESGSVGVIGSSIYNSHDCPIADENGLNQLEKLLQNAIAWIKN